MAINEQAQNPPDDSTAEEIIGILTAIAVVSKRLAQKLRLMEQEGGTPDEQDARTRPDSQRA
jgi:hypothetical protein